ncbi:MAG TPA: hypothetical protein VHZ50_11630 [Puia sp.]|jgi:hypothetical protein|nr:hypothetical protein [Puia sp.]
MQSIPFRLWLVMAVFCAKVTAQTIPARERICGKWENKDKTLKIQIYMVKNDFCANIIWFSDTEGKPMSYWKDKHNPSRPCAIAQF